MSAWAFKPIHKPQGAVNYVLCSTGSFFIFLFFFYKRLLSMYLLSSVFRSPLRLYSCRGKKGGDFSFVILILEQRKVAGSKNLCWAIPSFAFFMVSRLAHHAGFEHPGFENKHVKKQSSLCVPLFSRCQAAVQQVQAGVPSKSLV